MENPEDLANISNERRQEAQQATMEHMFRAMDTLTKHMERLETRYQAREKEYEGDGSDEGEDDQVTLVAARGEKDVLFMAWIEGEVMDEDIIIFKGGSTRR